MTDDSLRKLLTGSRDLEAEISRLSRSGAATTAMQTMLDIEKRARETLGPLSRNDLMRAAQLASPLSALNLSQHDVDMAKSLYEASFALPAVEQARQLLQELDFGPVAAELKRYEAQSSQLQRAIESMQSPWLKEADLLGSARAMVELIGMGHALDSVSAFDHTFSESLRSSLGDWRDTISWPEPIFIDSAARFEFYVDRGFDRSLTDFPEHTFEEGLDASGLTGEPPLLVDLYGSPIPPSPDAEEEGGVRRTNVAHDWLFRLETQIRHLIQTRMTARYGPNWPRHKLPNGMYDAWQNKQRESPETGITLPLISYADFTDYQTIICKRDLWREVFAQVFDRKENVKESLQRLHPIRICTMHARVITSEDELYLYVEARRIYNAIRGHLA